MRLLVRQNLSHDCDGHRAPLLHDGETLPSLLLPSTHGDFHRLQAAISSIGGVIGYAKKGSKASLVAGVICGGVYAFSGYLINSNNEQGHDIAAVTSVLLAAVMGARVFKSAFPLTLFSSLSSWPHRTRKFMPAGLVTICATAMGSYSAYHALTMRGEL
jgi:uncharacterized membrane protein (UPF0136 family)